LTSLQNVVIFLPETGNGWGPMALLRLIWGMEKYYGFLVMGLFAWIHLRKEKIQGLLEIVLLFSLATIVSSLLCNFIGGRTKA
jgi:hypothetical protein